MFTFVIPVHLTVINPDSSDATNSGTAEGDNPPSAIVVVDCVNVGFKDASDLQAPVIL